MKNEAKFFASQKPMLWKEPATDQTAAIHPEEPFTDGEWYVILLMETPSEFTDSFRDLLEEIRTRFTAGEWQAGHEQEISLLVADVAEEDRDTFIKALAIDAFLAGAGEEDIARFNILSLPPTAQKEYEAGSKWAPKVDLHRRGFSNGKYKSHGIFSRPESEG